MSFLDKILGTAKKLAKAENVITALEHFTSASETTDENTAVPSVSNTVYHTDDSYFASIITQENFPSYSITANVHAKTFDASAHPKCYPISYLFSKDGQPVLAVLVMNKNQYRAMIAVGTYQVLDNSGIKYIRFFKGMENNKEYVINRIRENLI